MLRHSRIIKVRITLQRRKIDGPQPTIIKEFPIFEELKRDFTISMVI